MKMARRLQGPALVVAALTLVGVTLASPNSAGPGTGGEPVAAPVPPQALAARKSRVPVRVSAPGGTGDRIALRQLVIATGEDDFGLATWKSVLDSLGSPYDVVLGDRERLDPAKLTGSDGVGRYNAILLTDNALLKARGGGKYTSVFDDAQWQILADYERRHRVRQVALNASPVAGPDEYCLRAKGETDIGKNPAQLTITPSGAKLLDYLAPDARIPLTQSYLYKTELKPGCSAEPLLSFEDSVAAVLARSADGRERAALTFSTGPDALSTVLLGYGLVRWATHGVMIGEQRHWFTVDVDDWFNVTMRLQPDGTRAVFRLDGPEAATISAQQKELRGKYPLADGFTLNLPYNAGRFQNWVPAECSANGDEDSLSRYSRCLAGEFRWINHTLTHPEMNDTSYDVSRKEIADNLRLGAAGGLAVPGEILKTPEYSGLGVYNPDRRSTEPPTDFGLAESNQAMLDAARDLGVKFLQGNMSFTGHRPSCFNCGIHHPLRPELLVVPDWPTNIAFEATTPAEQSTLYNAEYKQGLDYNAVINAEADVSLRHLMNGSAYAHTLHQGNLHVYEPGRSVAFDWITATVDKYAKLYRVPLKAPDWTTLAHYTRDRTAHFTELAARHDAIWDRTSNTVSYTPDGTSALFVTGLETREATDADQNGPDEGELYGSDSVSRLDLTAGNTVVVKASPRT
ncbi:hypothetical protein [Amycolatopsis sp. NPDC059657]|uniref:Agd3-related carbohydrate-binding protein n=1 Tax=Amycolatopsis sp. NPDC059657 TaxID=3346899 RepID=UPI00367059A3